MKRNMNKILSLIIFTAFTTILFSSSAFAYSDSSALPTSELSPQCQNMTSKDSQSITACASTFTHQKAITEKTDLSISYLGQIFGSVDGYLSGSSGQMFGVLMEMFNIGILVLAGFWLIYTVFFATIKAATEGNMQSMGGKSGAIFVVVRLLLGFVLLIPNTSTGYSLSQDIVMETVVAGVGLADSIWSNALDYLANGGTVWISPNGSDGKSDPITTTTGSYLLGGTTGGTSTLQAPAALIFANEVCMLSSQDYHQTGYNGDGSNSNSVAVTSTSNSVDFYNDSTNARINFPSALDTDTSTGYGCGYVSYNIQGTSSNVCSKTDSSSTAQCTYAELALYQMATDIYPGAYEYYCSQHNGDSSSVCSGYTGSSAGGLTSDVSNYLFTGVLDYYNLLLPVLNMMSSDNKIKSVDNASKDSTDNEYFNTLKQQGWMMAGSYYWILTQIGTNPSTSNASYQKLVATSNNSGPINPQSAMETNINAALSVRPTYVSYINDNLIPNYSTSQSSGSASSLSGPSGGGDAESVLNAIFSGFIGDVNNILSMFKGSLGTNPIMFLHILGSDLINMAAVLWITALPTLAALLIVAGAIISFNFGAATGAIIGWLKPLVTILASICWSSGFMLAFYVPLRPFMVFTVSVLGWLISVIEAMVAAPIVCLGMTHPEGHDFLGVAKQAIMLLLGVLVQPALLVIGLFAGLILSDVGYRITIETFGIILQNLAGKTVTSFDGNVYNAASTFASSMSSGQSSWLIAIFVVPLLFVIFTILVYTITNQSFSVIYLLRDNVMRWIGAPASGLPHPEQVLGKIEGGMSSASQSAGQLGKGAMSQIMGGKDDDEKKDASASGGGKGDGGAGDGGAGAGGGVG